MESLGTDSPHRLGRYVLGVRLAVGGMAEVWLARQDGPANFTKQLVVKKILPQFAADEAFVEMFLNEARLAALLNHPNVVQIFELGEENGSYFLVMEFIHGRNLRVLHKRAMHLGAPLPFAASAFMLAGACEGLHHAHQLRDGSGKPMELVHRDISPDNILVSFDGQPKVVDFGIAKAFNVATFTQPGTLKGKFAYMSPEQALGKALDRRADVYSAGVVLYELLSGKKPFQGDSQLELMRMVLEEPPIPLAQVRPDVPQPLVEVVTRALAKNKEDRYPDARSMARDLEAYVRSTSFAGMSDVAGLMDKLFGHERDQLRQMGLALTPKPETQSGALLARSQPTVSAVHHRGEEKTEIGAFPFAPDGHDRPPPPPPETKVGVKAPVQTQASIPTQPLPAPLAPTGAEKRRVLVPVVAVAAIALIGAAVGVVAVSSSPSASPSPNDRSEVTGVSPPAVPETRPASSTLAVSETSAVPSTFAGSNSGAVPSPPPVLASAPKVGVVPAVRPTDEALKPGSATEAPSASPADAPNTAPGVTASAKGEPPAPRTVKTRRPASPGKISVRVNPWAEVSVDGKVVGVTPLPAISAEPGRHVVKLANSELGKSRTITVDVKPGKESVLKVDLLD